MVCQCCHWFFVFGHYWRRLRSDIFFQPIQKCPQKSRAPQKTIGTAAIRRIENPRQPALSLQLAHHTLRPHRRRPATSRALCGQTIQGVPLSAAGGRQATVTLDEELQFAESYSFLLKNRFEEGAFSLALPSGGWDKSVPVLILQNALDCLVRTQNLPLNITVKVFDAQLCIACGHLPQSISLDAPGHDWRQLENNGDKQAIESGQLLIFIPFTQNTAVTRVFRWKSRY